MKLKTSYFNGTVLRKDITRFAPVWALYTIFQLMAVLLLGEDIGGADRFANEAPYIMQSMGIINLLYVGLCTNLLFGDLFSPRMCNALHAMPLRREGWFLTHTVAGFLFCLVPNLLGCGLAALLLEEFFYLAFVWLGLMCLQSLFFFGIGAFAAICAGNRLGAVAIYGIINFFAVIAAWLAQTFYEPFLPGIELDLDKLTNYSPIFAFSQSDYVMVDYGKPQGATFKGFFPLEWNYLYVAAAVGLVFLILAMLVYRKRKLESAGDFISLRSASPVFLVIYTLCVGAVFYYLADIFADSGRYLFLFLGFVIGFFTGRMLLERKVNVFRGKTFLAFALLILVFLASIGLTWLDPLGITKYVPQAQQVQEVTIDNGQSALTLTEQADIQKIVGIHQLQIGKPDNNDQMPLTLSYVMKDGTTLERHYTVSVGGEEGKILKGYFSSPECILGTADPDALLSQLVTIEFISYREDVPTVSITAAETTEDYLAEKFGAENTLSFAAGSDFRQSPVAQGLIAAIVADCETGNMARYHSYHKGAEQVGWVSMRLRSETSNKHLDYSYVYYQDFPIYGNCTNTIAYLQSLKTGQDNG